MQLATAHREDFSFQPPSGRALPLPDDDTCVPVTTFSLPARFERPHNTQNARRVRVPSNETLALPWFPDEFYNSCPFATLLLQNFSRDSPWKPENP